METTANNDDNNNNQMEQEVKSTPYKSIGNLLLDSPFRELEGVLDRKTWSGVRSEYVELDNITNGWQRGELTVIAGRPSMGKTSFLLTMISNICMGHQVPTGFISLEMGEYQFLKRLFTVNSCVSHQNVLQNKISKNEQDLLLESITDMENAPLYVDCTPTLTITKICQRAIEMLSKHGIKLLIIDYLQLIEGDNTVNRYEEMSSITRQLKKLAKELNIPIIVTSQMNRKSVSIDGYKSSLTLNDLRDSGTIEEDSDVVCFLERPALYGVMSDERGNYLGDKAILTVAKNRSGITGELFLQYLNDGGGFLDYEIESFPFGCLS